MGYFSTIQVIRRGGKNRQYYVICPAPLAQALEIEKGEVVEWVVEDKYRLTVRRSKPKKEGRKSDERGRDGGGSRRGASGKEARAGREGRGR